MDRAVVEQLQWSLTEQVIALEHSYVSLINSRSVHILQAHLRQKYLQPVAKTKVYSKEEGKEQAARIQRLVEGLGAYEKPQ